MLSPGKRKPTVRFGKRPFDGGRWIRLRARYICKSAADFSDRHKEAASSLEKRIMALRPAGRSKLIVKGYGWLISRVTILEGRVYCTMRVTVAWYKFKDTPRLKIHAIAG